MATSTVETKVFERKCEKVLQTAKALYNNKPDWVTFFRIVLGV